MSIIPGIENLAPERTETSSGLAGSPKPLPVRSSTSFTAASDVLPQAVRQLLAVGEVVVARLGGDRESGRGRQAGERHLGEARALAAEQVLHRAVAFGGARAPGVDVALRGGVRTIGGCSGLGHRGGLLGWQAGTLVQRPADASRGLGRIVRRASAQPGCGTGCDGSRPAATSLRGRPARPASRATLGRVRRRARSTGSAGRPRARTTPTGAPTRDPFRRRHARHRARGRGVQRHPRQARRPAPTTWPTSGSSSTARRRRSRAGST